jgi:thiol-disulfide isomerase/thioredoxin
MKRSGLVAGVMVLVVVALIWAGWVNLRARRAAMAHAPQITIIKQEGPAPSMDDPALPALTGKAAPKFTLTALDGKKVSLSDFKGHPMLINFWATWCGPCKVEMPWFQQFQAQYAGQGFQIVGIADDDAPKETIASTAEKLGVTYPVLITDGKVPNAYGATDVLPMSFYVDKKGTVVSETAGLGSKDEIEANIRKTIAAGGQ